MSSLQGGVGRWMSGWTTVATFHDFQSGRSTDSNRVHFDKIDGGFVDFDSFRAREGGIVNHEIFDNCRGINERYTLVGEKKIEKGFGCVLVREIPAFLRRSFQAKRSHHFDS